MILRGSRTASRSWPFVSVLLLLGYKGALPPKLTEIAVLMTARHWTQQFIWNAHIKLAEKAGVRPDLVQAIAKGRRSVKMADDEAMIYDFCDELLRNRSISDATYARALAMIFGFAPF